MREVIPENRIVPFMYGIPKGASKTMYIDGNNEKFTVRHHDH